MEILFGPEGGSPKFHCHETMLPEFIVERSVNCEAIPTQTVVGLKLTKGSGFTIIVCKMVSIHPKELVAISITVKIPEEEYV